MPSAPRCLLQPALREGAGLVCFCADDPVTDPHLPRDVECDDARRDEQLAEDAEERGPPSPAAGRARGRALRLLRSSRRIVGRLLRLRGKTAGTSRRVLEGSMPSAALSPVPSFTL
jgi:hypothetical protein